MMQAGCQKKKKIGYSQKIGFGPQDLQCKCSLKYKKGPGIV